MLSSWKEIAHFFGKGVRTVQRWEKTLDLPIHRPPGAPSNVVLARTSDLEEWHRGPISRVEVKDSETASMGGLADVLNDLEQEIRDLSEAVGLSFTASSLPKTEDKIAAMTLQVSRIHERLTSPQAARAA